MSELLRVLKLGGSLFELPDLEERLSRWMKRQPAAHHVLVAGGGALVDQLRKWHRQWPLQEQTAHWMCIDLMSVTARQLASRLPAVDYTSNYARLRDQSAPREKTIFDPARWLRSLEPEQAGTRLGESWDVSSDAIAGRLAVVLGAGELVLLKSCSVEPAPGKSFADLARAGIVDEAFPTFSSELPDVRVVNLREEPCPEARFRTSAKSPRNL